MTRGDALPGPYAPLPTGEIPNVFKVRQEFDSTDVSDVRKATVEALQSMFPNPSETTEMLIGIATPSRGIRDIVLVLQTTVEFLRSRCKKVVLLGAMGSHGGGTSGGELSTLSRLGITPNSIGTEIWTDMKTQHIGTVAEVDVYVSEDALRCDGVILVNRIKEHTDIAWPEPIPGGFFGLESGWSKELALGLSKLNAKDQHFHVPGIGLGVAIETSARRLLEGDELNVLGGIGIVENAYDRTASIQGARCTAVSEFMKTEAEILSYSKKLMPSLPIKELGLLYCMWLGKNKSGQGMHTKTIGRSPFGYQQGRAWRPGMPEIWTIVGSRLTPESGGNAIGWGLCEVSTEAFAKAVDPAKTALNSHVAFVPCQARRPILVLPNDRLALQVAFGVSPGAKTGYRAAFIKSTLELTELYLSESVIDEARCLNNVHVISKPSPLRFDRQGYVCDWMPSKTTSTITGEEAMLGNE